MNLSRAAWQNAAAPQGYAGHPLRRITTLTLALGIFAASEALAQNAFEQILVPFDTAVIEGGRAARWSAELRVRNSADVPVNLFPDTCSFIGVQFPCELRIAVPPGATRVLDVIRSVSPANPGVLLYVPTTHGANIHFTLTVRDLNSDDSVGTTIPVIPRSRFVSRATIVGVPVGSGKRHTFRVYDPSLPPQSVFRIRVIDEATERTLADRQVSGFHPTSVEGGPPLLPDTFDFSAVFAEPEVLRSDRVTVTIERLFPAGLAFWPMISVTSDRNHHFAIFTPN